MKLISHKLCPFAQRVRIVLEEHLLPYELEFIDLANKPDWFRKISPTGKVPVLLVDDEPLFESTPIAEFIDDVAPRTLHPNDPFQKARIRAWVEFASGTLAAISVLYSANDSESFDSSVRSLRDRFETLEAVLEDGPYFNGDEFSLVDAAFAPVFRYFEVIDRYRDFGLFENLPQVASWRAALAIRPSVQDAVVTDFAKRLHQFFLDRESWISALARDRQVA